MNTTVEDIVRMRSESVTRQIMTPKSAPLVLRLEIQAGASELKISLSDGSRGGLPALPKTAPERDHPLSFAEVCTEVEAWLREAGFRCVTSPDTVVAA